MRSHLFALAVIPAIFLSGCNDPKEANDANFTKAINEHLAKKCIIVGDDMGFDGDFPATIDPEVAPPNADEAFRQDVDRRNQQAIHPFDVLVDTGLLKREDTTKEVDTWGKKETVPEKIYSLTDKGKAALVKHRAFCAGHQQVASIKHFSEPGNVPFGGGKMSEAVFTTKAVDVPDWAKDQAVQDAWPSLKRDLDPDHEQRADLIQTNKGWIEAHDFDSNR
ncbi:hypothetical protein LV478_18825 (plasmid) [Komagataeibacter oboediens]|nr:hypothetical protein LV478_19150 [Komagataeibacter oboediens]WEQ54184.1 hypothetical protein LV478_18825 [Komagataeibacter oboediens]